MQALPITATPTRYNNAEQAEERYGGLARDYAAALSCSDELADAALRALDAFGESSSTRWLPGRPGDDDASVLPPPVADVGAGSINRRTRAP